ncbi:MAG: CPBP family intramembrane metalloprotease [Clostridia bacterium]|nr:CPBP family intramembrane metalloprotease [Clostridia bacterium]
MQKRKFKVENNKKSIFKVYFIYFVTLILFCGIRIMSSLGAFSQMSGITEDVVTTLLIQVVVVFFLPVTMYCMFIKVTPKQLIKTCNFYKPQIMVVLISLGLGVLCFIINVIISTIASGILSSLGYSATTTAVAGVDFGAANLFKDIILIAVLPAFCEEVLHRGILLQGTKHSGFKKAIILSALCFGLIHLNISQFFFAFVVGIIIGFVSVVSKNIWTAIIIHFTTNALSVYLDYAAYNGWVGGDVLTNLTSTLSNYNVFTLFIVCAVFLIVLFIVFAYLIWVLYKYAILNKVNRAINTVYTSSDVDVRNSPILTTKGEAIQELLESNTVLNLDYEEMKSPIDIVMPKQKEVYDETSRDRLFLYGILILGGLITVFTFIWGIM